MLWVRIRKCVLALAAAVLKYRSGISDMSGSKDTHVTKSSGPKSKRKMRTKNWKVEKYKISYLPLLQQSRKNNPHDCKKYLRMGSETSDHMLCLVTPHITKQDVIMRKSARAEYSLNLIFHRHVFGI
jgi:hypothetical protein